MTTSAAAIKSTGRFHIVTGVEIELQQVFATVARLVRRRPPTRSTRWIDVRDLRALVRQQHGRQRTGDVLAEVDDFDAC